MYVYRIEHTFAVEEVLERILERGMVLDGLSHLAAMGSTPGISASASADNDAPPGARGRPGTPVPPRPDDQS